MRRELGLRQSQEGEDWFTTHFLCDHGHSLLVILVPESINWAQNPHT